MRWKLPSHCLYLPGCGWPFQHIHASMALSYHWAYPKHSFLCPSGRSLSRYRVFDRLKGYVSLSIFDSPDFLVTPSGLFLLRVWGTPSLPYPYSQDWRLFLLTLSAPLIKVLSHLTATIIEFTFEINCTAILKYVRTEWCILREKGFPHFRIRVSISCGWSPTGTYDVNVMWNIKCTAKHLGDTREVNKGEV